MMRALFRETGARRLWVAAGLSLALHAAVVISVQRHPDDESWPQAGQPAATPLMARLATAVSDAVLPATEPATMPAIAPETQIAETTHPAAVHATATPQTTGTDSAGDGSVHYFKASELDRRPFPLSRIEVPVPESADATAGSVTIRLRVSERGRVEDAKIVMGTGITEFETAALRKFAQASFHPGYRGNLPVRSEMLIEVTLRPPAVDGRSQAPALPPQT